MAQLIKKNKVCHKPDDLSSILNSHTADKNQLPQLSFVFHICTPHTQINKCEFKKKLNVTIEKTKQANKGSSNKSKYTGYIKGAQ